MRYKLTITKTELNPNYETALKEFKEASRYGGYQSVTMPNEENVVTVLEIELTEEQFKKVKAESLKAFE